MVVQDLNKTAIIKKFISDYVAALMIFVIVALIQVIPLPDGFAAQNQSYVKTPLQKLKLTPKNWLKLISKNLTRF